MSEVREPLLKLTDCGLYCPDGDFTVDPWKPVDRAIVTHAHADHARWGMGRYLCAEDGAGVLRLRLGESARIDTVRYGEPISLGGVTVSLHPAGHILGSTQIRIERAGEVAVVSGDYKAEPDRTCLPYEPVKCHLFVTESTFGLPIYRWDVQDRVFAQIDDWWLQNQRDGRASLLLGYALGKAQRLLAGVNPEIGPIFVHGAVRTLNQAYRDAGIALPQTHVVGQMPRGYDWSKALIVAPPGAQGTPWARRFGEQSSAFASGWMRIRGARRRRAVDRGFVLSDHVDWPSLLECVRGTGAEQVWVTHGYSSVVSQYLKEYGLQAEVLPTRWEGDQEAAEPFEETD